MFSQIAWDSGFDKFPKLTLFDRLPYEANTVESILNSNNSIKNSTKFENVRE